MGYALFPMTPTLPAGLWAQQPHSMDSVLWPASLYTVGLGAHGTAAWPATNLAIYVPVRVKTSCIAYKLWFGSEATGTGNIDIGIYNAAGTRLVNSGSVAHGTASTMKVIDITDTRLKPGLYYIALQGSNATDTYFRSAPAAPNLAAAGIRSEAVGSFGLPATATWVVDQTLAFLPSVGILEEPTYT
jgi:hypothetical protein